MVLITPTDSRVLDANSAALGVSVAALREAAGRALADFLEKERPGSKAVFVCGTGNNAGDGLAVARQLQTRNHPSRVFLCTDPARFRGEALVQDDVERSDCGFLLGL